MVNSANINNTCKGLQAKTCNPFSLIIGVICGSKVQIRPLLDDINNLRKLPYLTKIEVHILVNGESSAEITKLSKAIFDSRNSPVFSVISGEESVIFPIGQARSKLQKVVGSRMKNRDSTYAWILDDDMRIPDEAHTYLTWLPAFKEKGIDVLIGNFNGSSPNPPAHGIRVQLNDLIHNQNWLNGLPPESELPNRSEENSLFRQQYPDYYYDLSRKHKEHLEKPYWLLPEYDGETVKNAQQRIIKSVEKILTGEPFLRPLTTQLPTNPLVESQPSCNRGGNTFILTSEALSLTPNAILQTNGEENRRSDMIWAIINRYYHQFEIHSISFPVYHHRYINVSTKFNLDKTISEIRGSALYASMLSFLQEDSQSDWELMINSSEKISALYNTYIKKRLVMYEDNFQSINIMLDKIDAENKEIEKYRPSFTSKIRNWTSKENFSQITKMVSTPDNDLNIKKFIQSLNGQIGSFS